MFAAIAHLKNAGPDDFKSIYALISGGEPLPKSVYETFKQRFHVPIYEGFGLTETSPVVALNMPHSEKFGSVGKPVPGVTVKIVDESGAALAQGEIGEVWLKGPMIMKGYYHLPDETAAALTPDGFFRTGDLGLIDDEGFLFITGRKKEMISVSGEKVYPREIEDIILRHPAVADVAVMGRKDPSRGEVVVAFVILKQDETLAPDAIRDHCRQSGLPQWKVPRDVMIVPELPRSPTGKVLKRVLAEQLAKQE
jgi:long-chain acyl-CoA synthetase